MRVGRDTRPGPAGRAVHRPGRPERKPRNVADHDRCAPLRLVEADLRNVRNHRRRASPTAQPTAPAPTSAEPAAASPAEPAAASSAKPAAASSAKPIASAKPAAASSAKPIASAEPTAASSAKPATFTEPAAVTIAAAHAQSPAVVAARAVADARAAAPSVADAAAGDRGRDTAFAACRASGRRSAPAAPRSAAPPSAAPRVPPPAGDLPGPGGQAARSRSRGPAPVPPPGHPPSRRPDPMRRRRRDPLRQKPLNQDHRDHLCAISVAITAETAHKWRPRWAPAARDVWPRRRTLPSAPVRPTGPITTTPEEVFHDRVMKTSHSAANNT